MSRQRNIGRMLAFAVLAGFVSKAVRFWRESDKWQKAFYIIGILLVCIAAICLYL